MKTPYRFLTLKQVGAIINSRLQFTTIEPLVLVFTELGSFIPKSYKNNKIFTLLHRAFKLCSKFKFFFQGIDELVDCCIKTYLNKVFYKNGGRTENFKKGTYLSPSLC